MRDLERQAAIEARHGEYERERQEAAELAAQDAQEAEAERLRAELRVLEAIKRQGVAWPGEY